MHLEIGRFIFNDFGYPSFWADGPEKNVGYLLEVDSNGEKVRAAGRGLKPLLIPSNLAASRLLTGGLEMGPILNHPEHRPEIEAKSQRFDLGE